MGRPDRYTQRTICIKTIPLELQYVIEHKQDGFSLISLETALQRKVEEAPKRNFPNPIRTARMYLQERESDPSKTYGEIAEMFGVGRGVVHNHIRLVNRLPKEFVNWLEHQEDPDVLQVFSEWKLRPITKLNDMKEQWHKIDELRLPLAPNMLP